jgi:DNA processing protein
MDGIKTIKITDEEYPISLRNIYNPPQILYCIGNISLLKKQSIAIVGCRKASDYGKKVAKIFSEGLSKNDLCIISGFASGIDCEAHKGALYNIGKTIAVLGSGLDVIYPKENESLYYEIVKNGGLIVSEFPLGTKPLSCNFPRRNRIISGLSNGVLVVEAKRKSGTMITVDYALEQGKEVFCVPRKNR